MGFAFASLLLVLGPLALPLAAGACGVFHPASSPRARFSGRLFGCFFLISAIGSTTLTYAVARPWLISQTGDFLMWGTAASSLAALLATAAYVESANARRAGRSGHRACDGCGYNLTGNVSGRCPECGAAA